jgi:hypothetical protein
MEKEKAKSERELQDINSTLSRLTAEIRELSDNYEKAASELRSLQEQAALMEKRLSAASKLILVRPGVSVLPPPPHPRPRPSCVLLSTDFSVSLSSHCSARRRLFVFCVWLLCRVWPASGRGGARTCPSFKSSRRGLWETACCVHRSSPTWAPSPLTTDRACCRTCGCRMWWLASCRLPSPSAWRS